MPASKQCPLMMKNMVCKACGQVGPALKKTPGSFLLELVLWLAFLLPGLLYSIWRHAARHEGCSACGSKDLIPSDTPMGRKLRAQFAALDRDSGEV